MKQKNILIYGDSLSWGIIPGTRDRYVFTQRWPGVLQARLGDPYRVIEECLNGRTTCLEDPVRPCRNGLDHIAMLVESHSPVALVVIFLGINDFQAHFSVDARQSSKGLLRLVQKIGALTPEPLEVPPDVLVLIPPPIVRPEGTMREKFAGFQAKVKGLPECYRAELMANGIDFIDLANHISLSRVDGTHLDADAHIIIADVVGEWIKKNSQYNNSKQGKQR